MVSQIGDRFTQMAFIQLLGDEFFGSFAAFGGIAVIFTLPSIILGPVTGPFIDTWRKKRVMIYSDIIRAFLILSLPFVYSISTGQSLAFWNSDNAQVRAEEKSGSLFNFLDAESDSSSESDITPKNSSAIPENSDARIVHIQSSSKGIQFGLKAVKDHSGKGKLLPILGIAFIVYIFGFFFNSAKLAFIPLIVPRNQYMQANSANMTLHRIATGLGTVAGGITVFFIGWRLGFFFDALTYVASFFLLLFIKVDEKTVLSHASDALREAGRKFSLYLADIKNGFKLMTQTLTMRFVMISIFALFFISGVAFSVILPTIQQTLGMGTPGVTVMAVAVAIGMVAGPVLTGVRGTVFKKQRIIIVSFVIIGILFAFGGSSYLLVGLDNVLETSWLNWLLTGIMAVVLFAAGALFAAINISQDTLIQERIPPQSRGRLFAWREMLASLAFVLTAVPAGFVAERVSFQYVLVVVGIVVALFALAWVPLVWKNNKSIENGVQR